MWLTRAQLLSEQPGGEWKACFYAGGNTSFLYLRKGVRDTKTLRRIRRLLEALPERERSLFRIVERDELTAKGADPAVVLALEPVVGVSVTNNRTGDVVSPRRGGTHGFISGQDATTFIAYGAGIKPTTGDTIRQTDIAPWILRLLGVR